MQFLIAGYEFKKGAKGVGYYLTVLPTVTFDPRSNKKQQQRERNAKKETGAGGYVNGPGGLKYRDMVAGRGAKPKGGQNVKCKYVLRLNGPNGRVVDKSGPRGFVSTGILDASPTGWVLECHIELRVSVTVELPCRSRRSDQGLGRWGGLDAERWQAGDVSTATAGLWETRRSS